MGSSMSFSAAAEKSPPKPPIPPTTSGRLVAATICLMASTARPPSAVSTPASSYVTCLEESLVLMCLPFRVVVLIPVRIVKETRR